jgi:N-acetyltransferase 10
MALSDVQAGKALGAAELSLYLTPFDLKRLEAYANNQLDYHVVLDMMPTIAMLYFENRLGENVKPTAVQSAILLALGLQRKTIEDVEVNFS